MKIENLTLTNFNGREFNITYYSLQDNHVEAIIRMALDHILEGEEKHG